MNFVTYKFINLEGGFARVRAVLLKFIQQVAETI